MQARLRPWNFNNTGMSASHLLHSRSPSASLHFRQIPFWKSARCWPQTAQAVG